MRTMNSLGNVLGTVSFALMIFFVFVALTGSEVGEAICNITSNNIVEYTVCRINQTY